MTTHPLGLLHALHSGIMQPATRTTQIHISSSTLRTTHNTYSTHTTTQHISQLFAQYNLLIAYLPPTFRLQQTCNTLKISILHVINITPFGSYTAFYTFLTHFFDTLFEAQKGNPKEMRKKTHTKDTQKPVI